MRMPALGEDERSALGARGGKAEKPSSRKKPKLKPITDIPDADILAAHRAVTASHFKVFSSFISSLVGLKCESVFG